MNTKRAPLILLIVLLFLAACEVGSYDPCEGHADSAGCQLQKAQLAATLQAGDMTATIEGAKAQLEGTRHVMELNQAATLSVISAQQTADAVVLDATRAAQHLNATGTSIAQSLKATGTAQAVQIQQTDVAVASLQTRTAIAVARAGTETRQADNYNGTREAISINATVQAAAVITQQKQGEADLARQQQWATTILGLLFTAALVFIAYKLMRAIVHSIDKRAGTVRGGANGEQVYYIDQDHQIQDLQQVVVTNMLTAAQFNQDGMTETQRALFNALMQHARNEQRVRMVEALGRLPRDWANALTPEGQGDLPQLQAGEPAKQIAAPAPFRQVLSTWRPSLDQILLAYDQNNQPIYGPLKSLLSVGIVGRQGTGKTNLLRVIMLQTILVGARAIVWDLHADVADGLPGTETYTEAESIERSAQMLMAEIDRRRDNKLRNEQPIVLLSDEVNSLAHVVPSTFDVFQRMIFETRKYRIFCMLSGKGLPAALFEGGIAERDSLSSVYSFQTSAGVARTCGFRKPLTDIVDQLPVGQALYQGAIKPQVVTVPFLPVEDVQAILATSRPTSTTSSGLLGSGEGSGSEVAGEAAPEVDEMKREQVRQLLKEGVSIRQIIERIWGARGGNQYIEASQQLSAIMATLV